MIEDGAIETRVLAIYGREVLIAVGGGFEHAFLAGRLAREGSPGIVVPGDIVRCHRTEDRYVVVEVLPRKTVFNRSDGQGRSTPIVANIDLIVVVVSFCEPPLSLALLDRFIAGAEAGGVVCAICVNKTDLPCSEMQSLELYPPLGYPVLPTSALTGAGIDELFTVIRNRVSALVGASGVGKSSIINRVLGHKAQEVRSLSAKVGRGRRTTSVVRFLPLTDSAGYIADTPGREWLGDLPLDPRRVADLFPEFRPFTSLCRFNDCSHRAEPGCAVHSAVSEGLVSEKRYGSFLAMTGENDPEEA